MKEKNITRRDFIKISSAGATVLTITPGYLSSQKKKTLDAKGLLTRKLGATGVEVPLIGLGCGSRFLSIESVDQSDEILNYALDHGIFYWDTAASYEWDGKISEERLGRVLKNRREEVWLSTKVNEREGDKAKIQIERSLKRLKTSYLDELKIHSIESLKDVAEIVKKGNVYDVVRKYKEDGVVKNIGFSGHSSAESMEKLAREYEFDTMLIAMNHYQNGDEKFEKQAIPAAAKRNMGIIAMKVVRPRETVKNVSAADLIRYALSLKNTSCAILGTDSLDILKKNINLVKDFQPLDESRMEELRVSLKPFFRHKNIEWMKNNYQDGVWV